ncbi:MAG: two-component sensor histidine kinase, partial [Erythrobacter sp.]|nr:two-component sensor histidine kinase [Erythrobacter sp.]
RAKMAAGIEDITRSLDDILSLARVGRADQPEERAELSALVEAVIEEFEQLGEPVDYTPGERIVLPVHVTWLRRGLRNLVSNALRYGGSAEVTLLREGDEVVMRVDDDGPGIPADQIGAMLEAFQRGEMSRNRATGGAGIGLTLARAIAEQHGGRLVLANRAQGGLRAEIRLPSSPDQRPGRMA